MRIRAPDSPVSSPESSPPPSPRVRTPSANRRTPIKHHASSSQTKDAGPSTSKSPLEHRHKRSEGSSPRVKLSEKNTNTPDLASPPPAARQCTWEELEFYNAVKQRQRPDPLEEYENRERQLAWQEAKERTQETWQPVADLLARPSPNSPRMKRMIEEAHDSQVAELDAIFKAFQLESDQKASETRGREDVQRKKFWDDIEATIAVEEARLAKIAAEREAARKAEEERQRLIREAEEAKQRAAEAEAKKKAELEAALKKKLEEEKEKKRLKEEEEKKKLEEEEKQRAEDEKKRRERDDLKGIAPKTALQEFEEARDRLKTLKTQIMPAVRGNKGDESMINKEWRKFWGNTKRSFTPKIGQVTNSQSEIERIAGLIHTALHPNPPIPPQLYVALLSSLSKAFLLQAEAEVTAKASTAYPLARLLIKIVELGNPLLPEVFMARLVGRTGGWAVGAVVPKYSTQTDAEFRKSLGYPPETSGETSTQVTDRFVGMLTLYAAILQNSNSWSSAAQVSYPFQLPRLWTLMARIISTPRLITDRMAPQILVALIETAGMRMAEVYGVQVVKMMRTLGKRCAMEDAGDATGLVGGKDGKAGRVRLGLLLEKWATEGKIGGVGRDVGS